MKKRILALLLCCVLCVGLAGSAFAMDPVEWDNSNTSVGPQAPDSSTPDKPDPPTPDRPSDTTSSSDDDDDGYAVSFPTDIRGGKVRVTPNSADKGDTVTITVTPDEGYEIGKVTVTDSRGNALEVKDLGGGKYSFVMPGSRVKVDVSFVRTGSGVSASAFTDVAPGSYCYDAVQWAVAQGITSGKTATTFAPNEPCTRAQIVTFLWRASGSPAATGANPFQDVAQGTYYYDAVLWAVAQGITSGTSAEAFSPNSPCTRGQAVTFLHRMEGKPAASGSGAFGDVAEGLYCYDAVQWAVEKGVTSGVTSTQFAPNRTCTRGQIVTFLYRDMAA